MKLVFDATFGEPWVICLRSLFSWHKAPRPLLSHIHELGARDQADDIWVPRLIEDDCIVLTGDTGRHAPRLPELCRRFGKTHIILSPTLQMECLFVKFRALFVMWPRIVEACSAQRGSRFWIQIVDAKHEQFRWVPDK